VSPPSLEDENRSSFRKVVFCSFRTPNDGHIRKYPVIPSVILHRQNPLEATNAKKVADAKLGLLFYPEDEGDTLL
jgi:hypothetical protein